MSETFTSRAPDGTVIETPATWLTHDQAQLMRDYAAMLAAWGLQAELVCGQCGKDVECYVQDDIGIFCDCRVRLWKRS